MKSLTIETSNRPMSVALLEDGDLVAEINIKGSLQHSTQLMPAIDYIYQSVSWTPQDIDEVIVSAGPGSYTGLRIGVTVAKTIAQACQAELKSVPSLALIAGQIEIKEVNIVPIMDARRGNVYTGLYAYQNDALIQLDEDRHVVMKDWVKYLAEKNEQFIFVGQDAANFKEIIEESFSNEAEIISGNQTFPRAARLASLGGQVEDPETFSPVYLKLAEAEENWQSDHQGAHREDYQVETTIE